jgi:hypothetical protein
MVNREHAKVTRLLKMGGKEQCCSEEMFSGVGKSERILSLPLDESEWSVSSSRLP